MAQGRAKQRQPVCPCHTDEHPSLHITVKEDALLVHCFPCGKDRQAGIVAALAERGIAVFPPTDRAVSKPKIAGAKTRVATYHYHSEDGRLLYRKHRYEWHKNGHRVGKNKTYSWERETGEGAWAPGLNGATAPIYRLQELSPTPNRTSTLPKARSAPNCWLSSACLAHRYRARSLVMPTCRFAPDG